jgi:hypothetical protein
MTIYSGNRSLDAEIKLNFSDGEIQMDYSLNKYGSQYSSNRSVKLKDTYRKLPVWTQFKCELIRGMYCGIAIFVAVGMPISSNLAEMGILGKYFKGLQFRIQNFYKKVFSTINGINEQEYSGELSGTRLAFRIPNNLWVDYEMGGDYEKYVTSVQLSRNFVQFYTMGKYPCLKQHGWNMVFEFSNAPKAGFCVIRYVSL